LAATVIRTEIERLAELEERYAEQNTITSEEKGPGSASAVCTVSDDFKRVVYGSEQPTLSVGDLEKLMQEDPAFRNFRTKLSSALARLVDLPRVVLQTSHPVK
jgi:hypothetical protein